MKKAQNNIMRSTKAIGVLACMLCCMSILSCDSDNLADGTDYTEEFLSVNVNTVQGENPGSAVTNGENPPVGTIKTENVANEAQNDEDSPDVKPAEIETWVPSGSLDGFSAITVDGCFVKNNEMLLYWSPIKEATGYIVLYGDSPDYAYSTETTEIPLIVPKADSKKTWYVAVKAKKGDAVSAILMSNTILPQENSPVVKPVEPVILDPPAVNLGAFGVPSIEGFFLKDNKMILYWAAIPEATEYIVLYGDSTDYSYSIETTKRVLIVPEIDREKTWYVAVKAKKWGEVSSILMDNTIQETWFHPQLQVFDPAVFTAEKTAWEAQKIASYRFTAQSRIGGPSLPFTVTALPNAAPTMEYDEELADRYYYPGIVKEDYFQPFGPLEGKTIDELFASVPEYIADAHRRGDDELYMTFIAYNETYHFIECITSRRFLPPHASAGWYFSVTDFEVLEP